VAGLVFVVGMTAILVSPATYMSSSRLLVSIEGSTTAAAYQNEEVATRRIRSYIPLLTSGVVTQRVIDRLGLRMSPSQLADEVSATNVPPKTSLIDIKVNDRSPDRAERIANTVATEFIAYSAAIETATGEDSQKVHTTLVSTASPARKDPLERAALYVLAALMAVVLGAVAVWIRATREQSRHADEPQAVEAAESS
jgi:capsular polysaccharide biosynthesis protein